jgi:hypothetical protein
MSETEQPSSRAEQLETLGMMAAHEAAIADLYRAYGKALPAHAALFSELAEEERKHARLVAGFAEEVRKGRVHVRGDRFSAEQVLKSLDFVREQTDRARKGNVTAADALGIGAGGGRPDRAGLPGDRRGRPTRTQAASPVPGLGHQRTSGEAEGGLEAE